MKIEFKPMDPGHREQVIGIFNYYVENSFAAYPEDPFPPGFFDELLKMCEGYPAVVAEDENGEIAGFGLLRPFHAYPAFSRTAFITYFLKPGFTRKGIGRRLLGYLIEQGRKKGITSILADISSLNHQSIDFHRNNGFVECGRLEGVGIKKGKVFDVVYMQRKV